MGFKSSKKVTKEYEFIGESISISKLSISQVIKLQELGKKVQTDDSSLEVIFFIIQSSVEEAANLTREQLSEYPLDDLSLLANAIMEYSGLGNVKA